MSHWRLSCQDGRQGLTVAGAAPTCRRVTPDPILIGSEIYRHSSYGGRHPLAIPRVSAALDLIRAMGWLDEQHYVDSPVATAAELARFHDPGYIAALGDAERTGRASEAVRDRYNIGRNGNPVLSVLKPYVPSAAVVIPVVPCKVPLPARRAAVTTVLSGTVPSPMPLASLRALPN